MRKSDLWRRTSAGALAACLCLSVICAGPASAQTQSDGTIKAEAVTVSLSSEYQGERSTPFNKGWKFALGDFEDASGSGFDDSAWEDVDLPHDFSITQAFTTSGEAESGFLPGGTGWYRKSFSLPPSCEGKTVLLRFDGVYSDAYVYVNGQYMGEHHYGYTSFAMDLSDALVCDGSTENVVAVKVVNDVPSSRWYSGSGIYRDVDLIVTDPVHVGYDGLAVTTPDIENGAGTVSVSAALDNDGAESVQAALQISVLDAGGETVASGTGTAVEIPAGGSAETQLSADVASPALWSLESPELYTLRAEVLVDGAVTDTVETTFGFRWFEFDREGGFSLNGETVKLNGVCLHHDQGALGAAAYTDAMERQLTILKEMGVNAIRTSHDPADRDFIDLCDRMGILVIEEAFDGWIYPKNDNYNDFSRYFDQALPGDTRLVGDESGKTWAQFALRSIVARDRNSPCIIAWSLGNELLEGCWSGNVDGSKYPQIAQQLIDWLEEVDTTRPATVGDNNAKRGDPNYIGVCQVIADNGGVVGLNYCNDAQIQEIYEKYPGWVLYSAETASAINSRSVYDRYSETGGTTSDLKLNAYDESAVGWGMTAHDSLYNTATKDYLAGQFVWTGFDYIGEPTPWNGTGSGSVSHKGAMPNSSYFGIVDTAGFPKDTYYLYRSQWRRDETTLHLVTAWDADNQTLFSDGKTPVAIYSNAPLVELYRGDALIGTATRTVNTTEKGYAYYTYTVASQDTANCTAVEATGADSLYATFNVAYDATQTLSAVAKDEQGAPISDVQGRTSVSAPGQPAQIQVTADRSEMAADGSSLTYVEVEIRDEDGTLDTTADQEVTFTLTGPGEIAGVDNGCQGDTQKYQQASALLSPTSAKVHAFGGKALAIVRSTEEAGTLSLQVSADGLPAETVSVTTTEVPGETGSGLVSYTMVRDYTVKVGTVPALETTATGNLADGGTVQGTIVWADLNGVYENAGDYTLNGTLTFAGIDYPTIPVSCRLHVIERVEAVRNCSAAVMEGMLPALPAAVSGIRADGTLAGSFPVTWDIPAEGTFSPVGAVVAVHGTAAIFGDETLPVTATVRVAEAVNTESTNVAPAASKLTQDIPEEHQSDDLESIRNDTLKPGDDTNERWSNWKNRTNSDRAALTFQWDTAQMLSGVELYYYYDSCSAKPEEVIFEISGGGDSFTPVEASETELETYDLGAAYSYTFETPVNPVALRITLVQQDGTSGVHCVALTECRVMTYAGRVETSSSPALSAILVDDAAVADFSPDTLTYTVDAPSSAQVAAQSKENAGITVLPADGQGVVRILTVSEDGTAQRTYTVALKGQSAQPGREALKAALDEAEVKLEQTDIYTGSSLAALRTAYDAAKAVYDGSASTDEACAQAAESLRQAIAALVTLPPEGGDVPALTVRISADGDRLRLTGQLSAGAEVEEFGFVYLEDAKLWTRLLNVNTAGRTRVICQDFEDQEARTYSYAFDPAYDTTVYAVRAYARYIDEDGRERHAYSLVERESLESLGVQTED